MMDMMEGPLCILFPEEESEELMVTDYRPRDEAKRG